MLTNREIENYKSNGAVFLKKKFDNADNYNRIEVWQVTITKGKV